LVLHKRLLTNSCRSKHGMRISPIFTNCGRDVETTLHAFWDCVVAAQVWLHLAPSNLMTIFFSFVCKDCIFNNIINLSIWATDAIWKTTFMITCWFLWTWRNQVISKDNFQIPTDHVLIIHNFPRGINSRSNQLLHCTIQPKEMVYIGRRRSHDGWIKLNSDGSCKKDEELVGCGSLLCKKIGSCDTLHVEMWDL